MRRRVHEADETGELNIIPYLDIVTNLVIFMMLSTIGLISLGVLDVGTPRIGQPDSAQAAAPVGPRRLDRRGECDILRANPQLIIWGCVSVTTTLPFGSAVDVRAAVRRSFRLAGRGRGFALASTSSIMPEVPDENIDALYRYGTEFGRQYLRGELA